MRPIRTLAVPTDFSDCARRAASYAVDLAQRLGAEIVLIHAFEPMWVSMALGDVYGPTPVHPIPEDLKDDHRRRLRQKLEHEALRLRTQGVKVRTRLLEGRTEPEILEEVDALDADLIIIGTHGYSGLKRMFLGSTAEQIMREAPCPVLTVCPETEAVAVA